MNKKIMRQTIALPAVILLAACADDGFDKETWVTSVKNSQLENPSEISISKTSTSDTTKTVVFSWPVVHGAGGYLMSIVNISDPANPVNVVTDSLIDRCSVAMELPNEETYNFCLTTAANTKYNNKQAAEASVTKFDTYVPSMEIPAGEEISAWVAANLTYSDAEQGFTLTAGETYTLDGALDFGLNTVEFRGDKNNAPTIIVGENGYITTQGGLKIRDMNIDCSASTARGLLTLPSEPDEKISTEALGYKKQGANQNGFVIQKAITFQNCRIKALAKSLLWASEQNWTLCEFCIKDCIIESVNTTSAYFIDMYHDGGNGLIQKLTISKSTIYSSVRNESESYFLRFSNPTFPWKVLGTSNNFLEWTLESSSFLRINPKKDFANNIPNTQNEGKIWAKFTDCVFFDTSKIYQALGTQWVKTTTNNFLSCSDFCSANSTDYGPSGRTDSNGNYYTTFDEEAEFSDEQLKSIDFSKPLCGLNLAPSGLAAEAKSGDPRWFE